MAVREEDILSYNFFQYGTPFFGSFRGMNYRIARKPLKNVFFDSDPHKNDDAQFEVTVWEGMENFETTASEKTTEHFPFTPQGRLSAVAWLDAQCACGADVEEANGRAAGTDGTAGVDRPDGIPGANEEL